MKEQRPTTAQGGEAGPGLDDTTLVGEVPSCIGRFVVLEVLGSGGMGTVYAVYDPELDRKLAVKLIRAGRWTGSRRDEARARLVREARAMARLSHPNVITVYDVGTVGENVFVAMELVEGSTLGAWLERERRSWRAVVDVMVQAGRGLAEAHRVGLVHRDFKPANALVGKDGRVRVIDFGLAGPVLAPTDGDGRDAGSSDSAVDEGKGVRAGTPPYMAPELLAGGSVDPRSDQFAFCVTAFEALYGVRPFAGDTRTELRHAMSREQRPAVPPDSEVPRWLEHLVLRGLSSDPAARFETMDALLDRLVRKTQTRRRWVLWGGFLSTCVGLSGWGWHAMSQSTASAALAEAERSCEQEAKAVQTGWNSELRSKIEDAFARADVPHAHQAHVRVDALLDEYAEAWALERVSTCRATFVEDHQSRALLRARNGCLDQLLREFRAVVEVLGRADRVVVDSAVQTVHALTSPHSCSAAALEQLPTLGESSDRMSKVRDRIAEVRALTGAGLQDGAVELARVATVDADLLGFEPLRAEALLALGESLEEAGEFAAARDALERALTAAEVGRHDDLAVRVWARYLYVLAFHYGETREAALLIPRMDAAVLRAGATPLRRALAARARGTVAFAAGDYETAEHEMRMSLEWKAEALGAEHFELTYQRLGLGAALKRLGRLDEANEQYDEVLRRWERELGHEHPSLAAVRLNLGTLELRRGDLPLARAHLSRARQLWARTDPEHPNLSSVYESLGQVAHRLGDVEEAMRSYRRAVELAAGAGAGARRIADISRLGLAELQLEAGDVRQAEAALEQIDPQGLDPGVVAKERHLRALLAVAQGRPGEGVAAFQELVESVDRQPSYQFDPHWVGQLRFDSARALEAAGEIDGARRRAAQAERWLQERLPTTPLLFQIRDWIESRSPR